jgi:hypothetical protein
MHNSQRLWRALSILLLITALCGSFAFPNGDSLVMAAPQRQTVVSHVVISQVYGGGGNSGAPYTNDFVELFNPSDAPISVDGWSIQYTSPTGAGNFGANVTNLTSVSIQPGQYYLVQLAAGGTNGVALPPSDVTGSISLSATGGKVILANTTSGLPCNDAASCAAYLSNIVDLIGYGNATYFETNAASAGSNTTAVIRKGNGCTDTDNNNLDFSAATPNPRNTASGSLVSCTNQFLTATAAANLTGTAAVNQTATAAAAPTNTQTASPTPTTVRSVLINEVAWGGTKASSSDEWFELYNTTGADINLNGWSLTADDGNPNIPLSGTIPAADPYFVFARSGSVFRDIVPDKIYSNGNSLANDGEILYLLDPNGNEVDTANLDGGAWPAGSGSPTFASMERRGVEPDSSTSWITYGGTVPVAHDRNGNDIKGTPGQANWISLVTLTPTATVTSTPTITPTSTGPSSVIINEVAWSGTSASTTDDEWIELYNPGSLPVDITGWHLYGDDNVVNKVGSPNITLKGTIAAGDYFLLEKNEAATTVTADQVYTNGDLLNGGERLYLKNSSGTVIDTANLDGGAWPAGTASVTTTPPPAYASMERVSGITNAWVTYSGTQPIAYDRNNGPIRGTPGSANWINSATITTITSDLPDPSLVNQIVTVTVSVIGGKTRPTGKVNVSAANTASCSITLVNGGGSCTLKFTSTGTKTLIAAYVPDSATHAASSDTESHQVSTSTVRSPTPAPTPLPPPPLLAINEFVPRPGHDWNNDGIVNTGDEYIEVLNHGVVNVNLSGYSLDDEVNVGSAPYRLPALTLRPGERHVFYGSETGLLLGDGGDAVRLIKPNGQLGDAYNYTVVERPDQSFCRLPDNGGADDWNQNCYPTPGLQNSLNEGETTAVNNPEKELYCPIADTLPDAFAEAECQPFGNNIWRPEFWDRTGWYGDQKLPGIQLKWPVFAN